jgi:hypothetical protein
MVIKSTGSGLGAGPFFVRDGKKTGGFSSGLSFAPMGADVGQFFSFTGLCKPNLFMFDPFFTNSTGTQNPTGVGAKFHPCVRCEIPPDPNLSHCHPYL